MLNKLTSFLCVISFLTGCAGRAANPVAINQFGDEGKSCRAINTELKIIENNVQRLIPESNKSGKNAALGAIGLFIPPAWLFMDLSTAEKQEINAYRKRHDHLVSIADAKNCSSQIANA